MERILVISDLDDFLITGFVAVVAVVFLLHWIITKLKSRTSITSSFLENEIENQLDNYTFNFENNITNNTSFGVKTKAIVVFMALMITVFPLYELIETLRRSMMFETFWMSCFPGY